MTSAQYFTVSKEPRYSLLFALPLLLLYEGLSLMMAGTEMAGVRNGADVLLKTLFVSLGGRYGVATFGIVLLGTGGYFVWRDMRVRGGALTPRVFGLMLVESMIYAAIFGQVVAYLTAQVLGMGGLGTALAAQTAMQRLPLGTQLVVSLGAGIYEELLFRVLLVSGILFLALRAGWSRKVSIAVAIVASALIFSGFHYIGPFGDPLTAPSFTFRALAGLMLSGLYVFRGFGIAAWTHALYDVGLSLLMR
jgi:hypothetical protein